jgi:hypothetical protein
MKIFNAITAAIWMCLSLYVQMSPDGDGTYIAVQAVIMLLAGKYFEEPTEAQDGK